MLDDDDDDEEAAIQNEGTLADAQAKIEQLKNELQTARTAEHKVPAESSRGSLLDRVVIRPKEHSTRRSYANLFARYFPGVTTMTIHEPYFSSLHQVMNLSDFLEMAASASNGLLKRAVLYTNEFYKRAYKYFVYKFMSESLYKHFISIAYNDAYKVLIKL